MARMEFCAPAKINLFLELIDRRDDGFHELETVMLPIAMSDRLVFQTRTDGPIRLNAIPTRMNHPQTSGASVFEIPLDQRNLVWQAITKLSESVQRTLGVDVAIQKNIPAMAGLGGGSSDAATTLQACNRLFKLGLDRQQLTKIAHEIGSDVAYFLERGVALCTGRGEKVQKLIDPAPQQWVVLMMPPAGLSTAQVYQQSQLPDQPKSSQMLLDGLRRNDFRKVANGLFNRLQMAAEKIQPWITKAKREFQKLDCQAHQMTGSGSAYFGLYRNLQTANSSARRLAARNPKAAVYCVRSLGIMNNA